MLLWYWLGAVTKLYLYLNDRSICEEIGAWCGQYSDIEFMPIFQTRFAVIVCSVTIRSESSLMAFSLAYGQYISV